MNRRELYAFLEKKMPASLREAWDNDGVMCAENMDREVLRVLCTLDVTDEVVAYAEKEGFDLILSHHPLIFAPLSAVTEESAVARRVLRLLKKDIAVFSFHTRLDAVDGGINDALAEALGLSQIAPLSETSPIGRIGRLPSPLSFEALCAKVKEATGAPVLSCKAVNTPIGTVAVVGGEGKEFLSDAEAKGADAYLSGRVGYHAMLDAKIGVIEMGHYFSEKHAASLLQKFVSAAQKDVFCEIYAPNSLQIY